VNADSRLNNEENGEDAARLEQAKRLLLFPRLYRPPVHVLKAAMLAVRDVLANVHSGDGISWDELFNTLSQMDHGKAAAHWAVFELVMARLVSIRLPAEAQSKRKDYYGTFSIAAHCSPWKWHEKLPELLEPPTSVVIRGEPHEGNGGTISTMQGDAGGEPEETTTIGSSLAPPRHPDELVNRMAGAEDRGDWLTVSEAARICQINKGTISRAANAGELQTNGKTGRLRRLSGNSFLQWSRNKSPVEPHVPPDEVKQLAQEVRQKRGISGGD
jgi:hypothetical protein